MNQYPKLSKRRGKGGAVIIVMLLMLGVSSIVNGVIEIVSPSKVTTVADYVQKQEDLAAKDGKHLTAEQRAEWEEVGRQFGYPEQQKEGTDWGIVMGDFSSILIPLAIAALLFWRRQVPNSKLAKMAAQYTAHLGEENKEKTLEQIDTELDSPVYESKQLAITKNWIVGYAGVFPKAVAIPVSSVTGVYYRYLIQRTIGGNFHTNYYYQIMINDKFDKGFLLRLKNKKQLDELFPIIADICSNADIGNYKDDYVGKFLMKSKEERQAVISEVLRKNQEKGMAYCER